jgi:hypothetical protein
MSKEELKRHKLPGTNQIPAEVIKAGSITISSESHNFIECIPTKCTSVGLHYMIISQCMVQIT